MEEVSDLSNSIIISDTKNEKISNYYFTLPTLIHSSITNIKMKELVSNFRNHQLVFNVESTSGAIFTLPDILQCGMLGISGISDDFNRCIRLVEDSVSLFKSLLMSTSSKLHLNSNSNTDIIDVYEIFGRIKILTKKLEEKISIL